MRTAVRAFDTDKIPREQVVRFGWLATIVAIDLWDDNTWNRAADRYLRVIRDSGALSALPLALNTHVCSSTWRPATRPLRSLSSRNSIR
jgi:hypothetical protein